jgi:hypothetical protein
MWNIESLGLFLGQGIGREIPQAGDVSLELVGEERHRTANIASKERRITGPFEHLNEFSRTSLGAEYLEDGFASECTGTRTFESAVV